MDPDEEIVRNINLPPFSFRGPEGWTVNDALKESGVLILDSPDRTKSIIIMVDHNEDKDYYNETRRNELYDRLMQQFGSQQFIDVGIGRYCTIIDVTGLPAISYIFAEGADALCFLYSDKSENYSPKVSDLSPYVKTILHD